MAKAVYQLERILGEGGFGCVHLARDTASKKLVAVKVLKATWDAKAVERFRREAEEMSRLTSARIIQVITYNLQNNPPFYVMPYLKNGSLRDQLTDLRRQGKTIEPSHALQGLLAVIEGLEVAHAKGIFHRDLKPENILIDDKREFVLTDFGIGKFVHRTSMVLTTGGRLGTPEYCAPEQWDTGEGSAAADIYSLGIVMFEMMAGRRPWRREDAFVPPSACTKNIPPELDELFFQMTSPQMQRISSCAALRSAILQVLGKCYGVKKPEPMSWGAIAAAGLVVLLIWGIFSGGKK